MKVKKLSIFLIFLFSPLSSHARQAAISGTVQDPSGARIAGAAVTAYSRDGITRRSTLSDSSGEFVLDGLPPAEYWIEVQARGFAPWSEAAVSLASGTRLRRDFRLDVERVSTRVAVTASSTPLSTDEISKAFDSIDSEQLQRRAEYSLADALQQAPGLRVKQLGGPGALASIYVRGMRSFDTSVLIDGFRMRDASSPQGDATGFLSDILLLNTERVEVLRGSGSSLYGSHAIAGVANLITEQGGGPLRGDVRFEGGGLGLWRGVARMSGGAWQDRLRFTGGLAHLNVIRGVDGNDAHRNSSAHGSAQWLLDDSTSFSGRVLFSDAFVGLNSSPVASLSLPAANPVPAIAVFGAAGTFQPGADDPDSRRAARTLAALASLRRSFTPGASVQVHYHAFTSRRDNRNGPGGESFQPVFNSSDLFDGRIDTLQARSDLSVSSRHLLSLGYELERERFKILSHDENPVPAMRVNASTSVSQRSHTVFAQEQLRFANDRLRASLSGRWQSFDLRRPDFSGGVPLYRSNRLQAPPDAWTGDAALMWFIPRTGTKLRAHAGNAYRAPSLYERFGTSFYFGAFSAYGDPLLRPERSIAFDAGFDQYLAASRLRVSGTFFYTRLQEVIAFDFSGLISPATDPYGRFGGYLNTGGGLSRGVELSVEAAPYRGMRLQSSYTYANADQRVSMVAGGLLRSLHVSPHVFTLTASQSFRRRWDVTFDLAAMSSYMFPLYTASGSRAFLFDGPVKADLAAAYTLPLAEAKSARFYVRIDNILDRTYFEDGFRTPGIWAVAGMQIRF